MIENFQFYKTDKEYTYNLYEKQINNIIIRLKVFKKYITLEFECINKDDFLNFYNGKNNIL